MRIRRPKRIWKHRDFKLTVKRKMRSLRKYLPKTKKDRQRVLVLATYISTFALFGVLSLIFITIVALAIFSHDLPNPNQLLERADELSTRLFDRNGKPIYEVFGEKNRSIIKLEDVSPNVVHATLAVEDSNFYQHQGISIRGILRAIRNTVTGRGLQGGSTITQQVVKNALLTQERTITRKLKELVLSLQLENRYAKSEIIQMYLNETPYGGQSYGVLTASKKYFGKEPNELSIAEAAFLAGLPQSPTKYSPYSSDPSVGMERKNYVLYLMNVRGWLGEDGTRHYLNDEDYEKAKNEEIVFDKTAMSFGAPHFVFYVKDFLAEMYSEDFVEQAGLQVTTTLDLELQEKAQEIVFEEVAKASYANVRNGGLVAMDPQTGQILVMVGSKDYFADSEPEGCKSGITGEGSCTFEAKLNVTLAKRQPGSSIKPITYSTMLSQGYTASFPLLDVPTVFVGADAGKDYIPENYDGEFRGPMSVRKSLGNSLNICAVKVIEIVGIDRMIRQSERMGISTFDEPSRYGPSLTLGGGETKLIEMTGAFSVFASGGLYRAPSPVLEVKDARGKVLYSWRDNGGEEVLSEGVAFLISDILSDDGARSEVFGFGSLLHIPGHQVAVKTGTTDDKRDNYAIGYTSDIAAGAWVGNNNNDAMYSVASGISGATPIWRRFILEYLKDKESHKFSDSESTHKVEVDKLTGMLPYGDHERRYEWFIKGTEPTSASDWYKRLEICKADGKLASKECKDADETETETFIEILAAKIEWQSDVDAWISENYSGENEYFPPHMTSGLEFDNDGDVKKNTDPVVGIVGFKDGDKVPTNFRLKVEVSSPRDIKNVKIYLDGKQVTKDKSYPYGYNFKFELGQFGEHEFKAVAEDEKGREGDKSIRLVVIK